jgi:hypothetical protein
MSHDALPYSSAPCCGPRRQKVPKLLQKLTAKRADCLEHAAQCRHRARDATDPVDKESWLQMAASWDLLAHSYGLGDRLTDFLRGSKRREQN